MEQTTALCKGPRLSTQIAGALWQAADERENWLLATGINLSLATMLLDGVLGELRDAADDAESRSDEGLGQAIGHALDGLTALHGALEEIESTIEEARSENTEEGESLDAMLSAFHHEDAETAATAE